MPGQPILNLHLCSEAGKLCLALKNYACACKRRKTMVLQNMPCSCHTAAAISQWPSARPQCDGGGFNKLVARNQPVQSVPAVPVIMMAPSCPWSPSDRIRLECVYACVMLRMGCSLMNCRRLIASSTVWRVDAAGPAEPKKQAGPWGT